MFVHKLFFVFLGLVVSCYGYPDVLAARSDLSLAKFIMQKSSQQALRADPVTSSKCFAIYLPKLENVANQWSTDYNNCLSLASQQRDEAIAGMKDEKDALSSSAMGVCQNIDNCQSLNETMGVLKCFSELSDNSISIIYSVSNNASDAVSSLIQNLQLVDVDMYKCTNASERKYVKDTADVYDALNKCLENGPQADTTTVLTTSTTPITTTTTNEPEDDTTLSTGSATPSTSSTSNEVSNEPTTEGSVSDGGAFQEEDIY